MAKRKKSLLATKYLLAAVILLAAAAIVGTSLYIANQQTSSEASASNVSSSCFRSCRSKCDNISWTQVTKRRQCRQNCRANCDSLFPPNHPPSGDYQPYPMPEVPGPGPNFIQVGPNLPSGNSSAPNQSQ